MTRISEPATAALGNRGLSASEVEDRVRQGLVNDVPDAPSRTTEQIVRANVFTRFNLLLTVLLGVIIVVGPIQDALFGIVLVVNTAIGIIQELRAKRTLDQLALLNAPRARAVRDDQLVELPVNQVVQDDLLSLRPGDQIVVDGRVVASRGLEVNEALLTGESDAVRKQIDDSCLSGSFVASGTGTMRATRVGRDAYAVALAEQARRFTLVRSELRAGVDWILAAVSWALVPTVALLVWSQLEASDGIRNAMRGAVAGAVGMVPQGLVLLLSVAFAVGVIRLGRQRVLVQELPAVEGLARVDVVCFDKTGTLTAGKLSVQETAFFGDEAQARIALGMIVAADESPNATSLAIGEAFPRNGHVPVSVVPFSSARKWSAAVTTDGTWFLGAPEIVAPHAAEILKTAATEASRGRRVVLLARSTSTLSDADAAVPGDTQPIALVALGDQIRSDAADTLRYFADQGVAAKVISGDHPKTVAAIAREVGIPGAIDAVDGNTLPEDPHELARVVEEATIFGRVKPHQKRAMVAALQSRGHVVAMTGDGVNDVLALKDADIGVAIGSGSAASRAVAQLVLMDGNFSALPGVVGEGRRVIANIERVANLFVTKTVYAVALAIAIGVAGRVFPFLPRHLTLVGSLTIGIPAFFLALEPSARRARAGFVKRVLRFAIPTGIAAAAATFAAYELSIGENVSLVEARTMATIVLAGIGFFALVMVSRPLNPARRTLIGAMVAMLLIVLLSEAWREFFALDLPEAVVVLAGIGILAVTGAAMFATLRLIGWSRQMPELLQHAPPLSIPSPETWWRRARTALTERDREPMRFWRRPDA